MISSRPADAARQSKASRWALAAAVAVSVAAAEVAGLRSVGMVANLPLAAQASAVPSLGAYHDVRWVLVYATGWGPLLGELAAAVAFRTAFNAFMVRVLWPDPGTVPAWRPLLARNAVASALLLVAFSPWAVLTFVTGVSSLSFPMVGGLLGALVIGVLVTAHAGIAPRWWTRWPPRVAMGWTAADFAVVTGAAVAIDYSPGWVVLVSAAAAGLLNVWCWDRLVRACAAAAVEDERAAGTRRRVLVPATLVLAVVAAPVVAASGVSVVGTGYAPAHRFTQGPPHRGQRAVLAADGFQSNWQGNPPVDQYPGFYTTQFSYAGVSSTGQPLPYGTLPSG